MNRTLRWNLLALAGCTQDSGWTGTSVGNPGELTVSVAPGEGANHREGSLAVASVILTDCAGETEELAIDETVDLLSSQPLLLPAGAWCALTLEPAGPLLLSGKGGQGHTYDLELNIDAISLIEVDALQGEEGASVVLELGRVGWLDAESVGLDEGDVTIGPGDPLHDELASAIKEGAALYADLDGDGTLDDDEREPGAAGGDEDDEDSDE